MAKRTVKVKEAVTLGIEFREYSPCQFKFTFASKLARLTPENDLQAGYVLFEKHIAAGNIVEHEKVGLFPGVPTYIIAKPDAPAFI